MAKTKSSQAIAAAAIRKELKAAFPETKFSVRSESASMMTAVDISWTDGPASKAVEEIVNKYQYGSFNSMEDIYEGDNHRDDLPAQVKYVDTRREISHYAEAKAALSELDNFETAHDLDRVAHILLYRTDLTSGYKGIRRTKVTSGSHEDFFEVVTGDSPAETPDVCHLCNQPTSAAELVTLESLSWKPLACPSCVKKEAEKAADEEAAAEAHKAYQKLESSVAASVVEAREVSADYYTLAKFARLNKNETLDEYQAAVDSGDYDIEEVKITKIVVLSPLGYTGFTKTLLSDYEFIAGLGGTDSKYQLPERITNAGNPLAALCNDPVELEKWRSSAYRLGVLVTDGEREVVVDPQGYNYARYVGLPVSPVKVVPEADLEEFSWL